MCLQIVARAQEMFNPACFRHFCDRLGVVVRRVVESVKNFFENLAHIICCKRKAKVEFEYYDPYHYQRQYVPIGNVTLKDIPVDLEALKGVIRNGGEAQISSKMTVQDFIDLLDAFPLPDEPTPLEIQERERIQNVVGSWVVKWAKARPIAVDPTSNFFPIIEKAFELRLDFDGIRSSDRYATYQVNDELYYSGADRFTYAIYSLIGFQEMSRDVNRLLFDKLDNHKIENGANPAYLAASAMCKIYTYPRAGGGSDIRGKLQFGLGAPWRAWEETVRIAQKKCDEVEGELPKQQVMKRAYLNFFQKCFNREYCFDARVSSFQMYTFELTHPHFEDLQVKVAHSESPDVKVARHYETFRNRQIVRYIEEHPEEGLEYQDFKNQILNQNNHNTQRFKQEYYTRREFGIYLQAEGFPIRRMTKAPAGIEKLEAIPFDRLKAFVRVNHEAIPIKLHKLGERIALRDPIDGAYYQAVVHRIVPKGIDLDLRGDPIPRKIESMGHVNGGWEMMLDYMGL